MPETMTEKLAGERFQAACPRCDGSGLWQQREGYPCRGCAGTGRVEIALKRAGAALSFYIVSAKGNVTRERFYAAAELTAPLDRYQSGATVGGGAYSFKTGRDPAGAKCTVYGMLDTGGLMVGLPGGGVASTDRGVHGQPLRVRLLDEAAAKALGIGTA